MTKTCNRCGASIIWGNYDPNKPSRPLNIDGTLHTCIKPESSPQTKPAGAIVKSPVNTPKCDIGEIIDEINLLKKEFGEIESAKFESIMKYAISRTMGMRR